MLHHGDHHHNAKTILALLILMLAFVIYVIFIQNKDSLMQTEQLKLFVMLAAIGMGFLVGLLYLASKPHNTAKSSGKKRK